MRSVPVLLVAALLSVAHVAAAEDSKRPAPAPAPAPAPTGSSGGTSNSVVLPSSAHALSRVHAGLGAEPAKNAGPQRDVAMSAGAPPAAGKPPGPRPAPTPRGLRKMSVERAMAAVEPAVAACAVLNPTVATLSLGLRVSVAPGGEVESSEPAVAGSAPAPLVACVVQAISAAHFGTPGPNGALVGVPVTVPGRPASVPPPAPPPPAPARPKTTRL